MFSNARAVPGIYVAGFAGRQVWAYRRADEPEALTEVVRRHGFGAVRAWREPAPDPENVGPLIVEAQRWNIAAGTLAGGR